MNQAAQPPVPQQGKPELPAIVVPSTQQSDQARIPLDLARALAMNARTVLDMLGKTAPDFLRLMKQVQGDALFHVVMKGEASDLKQAGDRMLHAWAQNPDGTFKEQALLKEAALTPEVLSALSDLATKAMLMEIVAKLDAVSADLRRLETMTFAGELGKLKGVIKNLAVIRAQRDEALRRDGFAQTALEIGIRLRAVVAMLRPQLEAMPDANTNWLKDGWRGGKQREIGEQWKRHGEALALLSEGLRVGVLCQLELGEHEAALLSFETLLEEVRSLKLEAMAEKARLAPYDKADPPEARWQRANVCMETAAKRIADNRSGILSLELSPEVLEHE